MFELRVLNGLHQGAALPLVGEQWLIGADDQHDLALYDPGIAALHCRLNRTATGWTLDAEDSLINDAEGHALTATALVPNQTFALGNTWLCLAPAEEAWPQLPIVMTGPQEQATVGAPPETLPVRHMSRLKLACGVLAGLLMGVAGAHWWLSRSIGAAPAPASAHQKPLASVPLPPTQSTPADTLDRISLTGRDEIRRRLNTLLSERLLSQVSIEDSSAGLTLKGNLPDDALQLYQRMLKGFHERYATSVPVLDQVATLGTGLPFVIAQIISGSNAHLVTADGHRLYIGDQLNGLRLTRIDDERIQFDGEQHIEVRW